MEQSEELVVKVICPDCKSHKAEYSFVDGVLECKECFNHRMKLPVGSSGRFKFGKHPAHLIKVS